MSQKLSEEVEKELEELRELIDFYSGTDEIRYRFSIMRYYKTLCKTNNNPNNTLLYQRAKEDYDKLFIGEVFSPNRKV